MNKGYKIHIIVLLISFLTMNDAMAEIPLLARISDASDELIWHWGVRSRLYSLPISAWRNRSE